jgi:predicted glycoside hydrolase/deacetylase ChbG (UPF0249 family)
MKQKLIIVGHDLGYVQAINRGFAYMHTLPKVFSEISLLAVGRASGEAVPIAKMFEVPINLSISLTNSKFKALTGVSSLTDKDGYFLNGETKSWDFSIIDHYEPADIEKEIYAQYEWFATNIREKPSAVVTQKREHGDPKILEPLIKLAKAENLPMSAPIWNWKSNYGAQSFIEAEGIKATRETFVGLYDWSGRFGYDLERDLDRLIVDLNKVPGVAELVLFTGFCDKELFSLSSVSWQRGQILNIAKRKYEIIERLYSEFEVIGFGDL